MSAQLPLYQVIHQRIAAALPRAIPAASITRLALLVTGILAAKSAVLAQIAAELDALALTHATPDSIARRLRRTLNDPHLDQATCYAPVLRHVLDWDQVLRGQRRVVLIVDESSKADDLHLFRVSLPYWGDALCVALAVDGLTRRVGSGNGITIKPHASSLVNLSAHKTRRAGGPVRRPAVNPTTGLGGQRAPHAARLRYTGAATGGRRKEPTHAGGNGATVLVVDDEPAITTMVCEALAEAGLRAQGCTQAAEAFWFIQRTEPSLVILDVRMPGVDGISLLHQLRADPATAGLPVLFLTAHADEVEQRLPHYAALGAQLVAKPFALDHLLGLVHQTLAARASVGEGCGGTACAWVAAAKRKSGRPGRPTKGRARRPASAPMRAVRGRYAIPGRCHVPADDRSSHRKPIGSLCQFAAKNVDCDVREETAADRPGRRRANREVQMDAVVAAMFGVMVVPMRPMIVPAVISCPTATTGMLSRCPYSELKPSRWMILTQ